MNHYYRFRQTIFDPLAWFLSKRELHEVISKASTNLNDILHYAENYVGRGHYASIRSVQETNEIRSLGRIIQNLCPKVIVEIGTYKGGTLFFWCRSNPDTELFVSIDLPGGQYGGGYDRAREKLYKEFIYDRRHASMELLRADSHKTSTLKSLNACLQGQSVDFLYIDGDHTYGGVKQDFDMYAPFVKNGLIAFHDIVTYSHDCGVYELWQELKKIYPTQEFIEPGSNKGIGIVFVGETPKMIPLTKNL